MSTSVKLKFLPSKIQGKEGIVALQLIHNRKVRLLRTRFRLLSNEWNMESCSIIFHSTDYERNMILNSIKRGLDEEMQQLQNLVCLFESKGNYSVDELVEHYTNNSLNGYLFSFIDYTIKILKNNNQNKTAIVYNTTKQSFAKFIAAQDIPMNNIDNELILKYELFLKNSGMKKNSTSCYIRALRSIYNKAVKQGLCMQKNPFKGTYTGTDKTIKRAVSEEVIVHLKNLDLESHQDLALTRDLFMFSFYMRGISFVDMANLKTGNIKNGYIVYIRSKTKQSLTVRLESCMQEIIDRYCSRSIDDYLLPVYTEKNRNHTSQLRTFNKRLKNISEILGLEKPLSSYVARHSWATIALRKKVPIEVISEGMGHENETTTRIYLASIGQSAVDEANMEIIRLK
jgi:site-specific recombinase XerD